MAFGEPTREDAPAFGGSLDRENVFESALGTAYKLSVEAAVRFVRRLESHPDEAPGAQRALVAAHRAHAARLSRIFEDLDFGAPGMDERQLAALIADESAGERASPSDLAAFESVIVNAFAQAEGLAPGDLVDEIAEMRIEIEALIAEIT
ncbi:MAG: hypothetical protein AAF322_03360 [Pseudomonadota bacterium]